jgi:hypothetical protein
MTFSINRLLGYFSDRVQSARVMCTVAFDLPAYSTNSENLVVTNLHSTNFA